MSRDVLALILDFMYYGEAQIPSNQVAAFRAAAEQFGIDGVDGVGIKI